MLPVVSALLACFAAWFRSRHSMQLEILALRHQLAVYQRSVPRPRIRPTDRLLWAWLARLWSGWQAVLAFVQPRTVIAWQKQRFRDYWRRLIRRGKPGRPPVSREVRELIEGVRYAHVIDPRTGLGVSERRIACVRGSRGLDTDPLATAGLILEEAAWEEALARVPGCRGWVTRLVEGR